MYIIKGTKEIMNIDKAGPLLEAKEKTKIICLLGAPIIFLSATTITV